MWRSFDGKTAPFLCPPKYYREYYKPLITESTKEWVVDEEINELIFEFLNGELDQSEPFLLSDDYKYLQHALRQRYLLRTAKIEISDGDVVDAKNIDPNTVDLNLIKAMLDDGFSLNEDMESIWFYTAQRVDTYGFYRNTFKICGKTKLKSYYNRKFKPIYIAIQLKIEGSSKENNKEEIGNSDDIYSLSFQFSDSCELFWTQALDDWDCWKEDDIKKFMIT